MLKQIALGIVLLAGLQVGTAWADDALNKALIDAVQYAQWSKLEVLISQGADVNAKGSEDKTALHILSYWGNNKKAAELLITKGADVNAKDIDGNTPLHEAAMRGNMEFLELLITKGADVNAKEKKFGTTPLHLSVYGEGSKEIIVELLIAKGAVVNAKDNSGWTPLHRAAMSGNTEVAELLISRGADLNAKDNRGNTPLGEIVDGMFFGKEGSEGSIIELLIAKSNNFKSQRELLKPMIVQLQESPNSKALRQQIIKLAQKLKPAPAVPEEARKYLVRGNALMGDAKNPGEARAAIQEYQNALLAAPWWDDAYFNLAKAQELAGDLDGAVSSMQYYLLTEPQDKREAQDRLYAIEAKRDKAKGK